MTLKNRIFKWLILLLGAIISLFTLVYSIREATKIAQYWKSGTAHTDVNRAGEHHVKISVVNESEFITPIFPVRGDTVISVDDSTATIDRWNEIFYSPNPPGMIVPIEFIHQGMIFRTELQTHRPYPFFFLQTLLLQIVRILLAFSFILVGLWAFSRRPDSGGVRALTLFSFSMASFLINSVIVLSARYALFQIPLNSVLQIVFNQFTPFFGSFWLNLQLLFPHPKRFIRKNPSLAYAVCYGPIVLLLAGAYSGVNIVNFMGLPILSIQILAGFIILAGSYVNAANILEKRQLRLVLTGSGTGLFILLIFLVIAVFFGEWLTTWRWNAAVVTLCFLALLLSPLSFALAFQRYRLLEVEGKLRRGTRYFLVTAALLALFALVVYLVGILLLNRLGIVGQTPIFVIALGLALGFYPALRKLQAQVERRFYPERYHLREVIRDFLQTILAIPDRKTLWEKVANLLRFNIKVDTMLPVMKSVDDKQLRLEVADMENTPFMLYQGITVKMMEDNRPLVVDEAICCGHVVITMAEEAWLKRRQIAILLPMVVHSNLVGFIALGFKSDGEDYSVEELNILNSLASQLALASENLRLLEENIEKKRMEEELNMARVIQRGLLPESLPETPGLQIAAGCRFCMEVAGDYYDVIPLPDNKTLIAVGDVSGKGAAAALLMANLQASLRTIVGTSAKLNDIVAIINNLIYSNTPSDQYITFFVGIYNPEKRILEYVNAGHNLPILIDKEFNIKTLDIGGLLLGVRHGEKYEIGTVTLNVSDLLIMYTDGVSEAMNAADEEFGEERMVKYIVDNYNTELHTIIDGLEKQIDDYVGDSPLADDFTLLLARVMR